MPHARSRQAPVGADGRTFYSSLALAMALMVLAGFGPTFCRLPMRTNAMNVG